MKNIDVIRNYLRMINAKSSNGNLWTKETEKGFCLMNYATALAIQQNNKILYNTRKYSVTTSKIQHYLRNEMTHAYSNEDIIEIDFKELNLERGF